jgi:hypothetical protein
MTYFSVYGFGMYQLNITKTMGLMQGFSKNITLNKTRKKIKKIPQCRNNSKIKYQDRRKRQIDIPNINMTVHFPDLVQALQ